MTESPAGRPTSHRTVVLALALWFGVTGAWTLYWETTRVASLEGAAAAVGLPEDGPGLDAGFELARISTVAVFGVLALVAGTGLLAATPWARATALTYLALAIAMRLVQSVGVLLIAKRFSSLMGEGPRIVSSTLTWWAVEIAVGVLAIVYLGRTDPSKSTPRSAQPLPS